MTLISLFSRFANALPPYPGRRAAAEGTSTREVNRLLAHGWRLLLWSM